MGLHYLSLIYFSILIIFKSSLHVINSEVQGCSIVGIDLQHCLYPISTETPITLDSCCNALNQALQAGYYCLCSFLESSSHPLFSTEIALSFSNCYISMPPLTHCHVLAPQPLVAPPAAVVPPAAPLRPPVLMPPSDDFTMPFLPPKVNKISLNSTNNNSSIVDRNLTLSSSSHVPKLKIPESRAYTTSNGANSKILMHSRNLMILLLFAYMA